MKKTLKNHLRDKGRSYWKTQDKVSRIISNRRVRCVINVALIIGSEEAIEAAENAEIVKRAHDYWNIFD